MSTSLRRLLFSLVVAALAAGCGGGRSGDDDSGGTDGDSNGGTNNGGTGGIDRGGIVVAEGTITGFGSVHVNGVRFVTTSATILVDGQPGTESDLRVGQVVRVEGTLDSSGSTGTASRIVFDDEVEGPIASIDRVNSRLVVLGRTVVVGPGTSFDDDISPRNLDGLAVGDRIEVSGLVRADGGVDATRIESKDADSTVEVKGRVSGVDTTARRFSLEQQLVSYATAQLEGFSGGQPANGDQVEVVGSVDGGVLVATRVEKESGGAPGNADEQASLEGLITRFASATDFDVAGKRVTTTSSTTYEGGSAANLALDVAVEVEGRFNSSGVVVATKVELRRNSNVEIEAPVDSVNASAGSLVVLGVTVRANSQTRFEDHSDADVEQFSLSNVSAGDFVELRATTDTNGLLATRIERDDARNRVEVRGPARSVAAPNLTVGGVAVTTDDGTQFRDQDGDSIDAEAFFQAAGTGREVHVRGTRVGNAVLADEAELED